MTDLNFNQNHLAQIPAFQLQVNSGCEWSLWLMRSFVAKPVPNNAVAAQQEIELLKKLAAKQKEQKRGLMQKLLTGEWRVELEG